MLNHKTKKNLKFYVLFFSEFWVHFGFTVKGNLKKNFEMLENGGLRLFLPKMQAVYNSGWHPSNIYSCWYCTKEVIQTAKIDIKIITHN